MTRFAILTLALSTLGSFARPAAADMTALLALKDNTLYEDLGGALSNGSGEYFFTGRTNAGPIRRCLVAFDVAAEIPAGSTIDSVQLSLVMSKTLIGNTSIGLHRVLADWGEGASDAEGPEGAGAPSEPGDATWIHTSFPGSFWATAGGDFDVFGSAVQTVGGIGPYTWGSSAAMVADVQSWLDSPAGNYGWLLLGDEVAFPSTKRFNTRENGDPLTVPMLIVGFTPLPAIFSDDFESGDVSAWSGAIP